MRKKLRYITSLTLLPALAATVSCSTSWTKWKTSDDNTDYETTFPKVMGKPNQWQVREIGVLMNAWDDSTETLDLDKINNHFELYEIIGEITKLSTTDLNGDSKKDKIDEYWKESEVGTTSVYQYMHTYLQNVNITVNIKIKLENEIANLNCDFNTPITEAIQGIENYQGVGDRAYNVERNGINSSGVPNDLTNITTLAASLLEIDMINGLMSVDDTFALKMAKLVNLPHDSFVAFEKMVIELDRVSQQIYSSAIYSKWSTQKEVDYSISPITGKLGTYKDVATKSKQIYKGLFLTKLLG